MTQLNNGGTKILHCGQNPHRNYMFECRIINPKKGQYLRLNFIELEYFITMAKQANLEMPFRVSASLFATKKLFNNSEEMFLLERQSKVPEGCANQMFMGIKSLNHLRDLFPAIKVTFEDADPKTPDDVKQFIRDIAHQFEYRPPTFREIMLWYTECDQTRLPADRGMHDLKREMLMNFGALIVQEVKEYCLKTTANNRWNFEEVPE